MSFIAVAIGGAAVVGAGASIYSAEKGSSAAQDAAKMQQDAANHATDIQAKMYEEQRSDQAPWRQAGANALSQMADPSFQKTFNPSDMESVDPGYKFRMQQGQQALERSAAARGGLQNGGTLKALTQYGQDYASGEYQNAYNRFNNDQTNRFNRLASMAGMGQTANGQTGQAGMNAANSIGNIGMSNANAQGAAGIAQANAWGNGVSGVGNALGGAANNWMTMSMMNKMSPGGGGGAFPGQTMAGESYGGLGSLA